MALPVVTKTGAYTATAADYTSLCNATSAGFSVTLPAAAGITGRVYLVKKIDSSANVVTMSRSLHTTRGCVRRLRPWGWRCLRFD